MFFTDANAAAAIFLSANSKSDHAMFQSTSQNLIPNYTSDYDKVDGRSWSSMTADTDNLIAIVLF